MSSSISDVANFFADRNVFITGGTGFLGKVLIEKLLRSVPRIQNIYVLIRSRKGMDAAQRWREMVENCELFKSLKDGKYRKIDGDHFDADIDRENQKIDHGHHGTDGNQKIDEDDSKIDGDHADQFNISIDGKDQKIDGESPKINGDQADQTDADIDGKTKVNADMDNSIIDFDIWSKVIPIDGDILESDLGLSLENSKMICENVSVVFHCAATVRFDERMRLAIRMNVEGTQRLLGLCDKMKRLDAFVHASTAYCNCDQLRIFENVYPSPVPWRRLVESLEWMNDDMFDLLTPSLIAARPNTYTFTKAVAESMIVDEEKTNQHLPIVIVRPSIVTAVWRDPLPGWIDNVNGATGLIAMGAKGLLRSMYGDLKGVHADLVPVDVVANTLIVAAWHRGSAKGMPMPVIHCTTGDLNPTTWGQVVDTTMNYFTNEMPLVDLYRIPGGRVTTNRLEHQLRLFFDHLVPAYVLDLLAKLMGQRPRMVRMYDKINKVLDTLRYFYTHEWNFQSTAIVSLNDQLSEIDRQMFYIDVRPMNWDAYYRDYHAGVRKFIFREPESNINAARKIQFRRRLLTYLTEIGIVLLFAFLASRFFVA